MSTNRLSHLKDGDKIYLEVTRMKNPNYISYHDAIKFKTGNDHTIVYANDNDTFYTLEELKQLANDGMPKQGEMIDVCDSGEEYSTEWRTREFVCLYLKGVVTDSDEDGLKFFNTWRFPKKTELTLAEVEEKLGLEKGSLVIK